MGGIRVGVELFTRPFFPSLAPPIQEGSGNQTSTDLHGFGLNSDRSLTVSQATSFADKACETNRSPGRTASCWKRVFRTVCHLASFNKSPVCFWGPCVDVPSKARVRVKVVWLKPDKPDRRLRPWCGNRRPWTSSGVMCKMGTRCRMNNVPPWIMSPRTLFTSEYCPPGHYSPVNNVPSSE